MIYTSYYARAKSFPNLVHIRISTSCPKWYPYETKCLPELYPGFDLVNGIKTGEITEAEYECRYKEKLAKLDKYAVRKKIEDLAGDKDTVLLCYEKDGDFCHRHLVADWLGNIREMPKDGPTPEKIYENLLMEVDPQF